MTRSQTFISALSYQDPVAALKWLERAFGFETAMLIMGRSGVYAPTSSMPRCVSATASS
ncbi:MAG: hypothetical protein WBW74_18735 [Xanthobacteraceae bacterium]